MEAGCGSRIQSGRQRIAVCGVCRGHDVGARPRRSAAPLRSYCTGLLLPGERKSVEPMAARVQPGRVQAAHQSLHHFVAKAEWSDEAVLAAVRAQVLPVIERQGPIRAWIIDDTGFPKKGTHSVGVARQYCGQLGKQDNCQVAVSLSVANDHASLPIAYRLYLPEEWADDPTGAPRPACRRMSSSAPSRRSRLTRFERPLPPGSPPSVVLADAGYGIDTAFRDGFTAAGPDLCRRHPVLDQPVAARERAAAAQSVERARSSTLAASAATPSTSRSRPSNWRWLCPEQPGGGSPGARAPTPRSPRASPPCASGPRIAIISRSAPRPEEWCLIEWPAGEASRPNTGSPPCPRASAAAPWSTPPSCAGASSATTRSSSRNSASATTRAAAGAASTITPRSASPPTDSWSPKGEQFPPHGQRNALLSEEPRLPDGYRPRGSPDQT